jgi:hypothetical protein
MLGPKTKQLSFWTVASEEEDKHLHKCWSGASTVSSLDGVDLLGGHSNFGEAETAAVR